jgi:hypothetical protein
VSFVRVNPTGWSGAAGTTGDEFTSTQANTLDTDHANALDKTTAGDTLSGVVTMASTAVIEAGFGGNIVASAGGAVTATVAFAVDAQAARALASSVAGGIASAAVGGFALSGAAGDWPTFGVSGATPATHTIYISCDSIAGATAAPTSTPETALFAHGNAPSLQNGGAVTTTVSTSNSGGIAYYLPLNRLHSGTSEDGYTCSGATLETVTLFFAPNSLHTALPTYMPRIGVYGVTAGGAVFALRSGSGVVVDSSASFGAYNVPHTISWGCTQNGVLDSSTNSYFLVIVDEGDTANSLSGAYLQGVQLFFGNIANTSWL